MNNKELYHYGVLGMKWGKRKGSNNSSSTSDKTPTQKKESIKMITSLHQRALRGHGGPGIYFGGPERRLEKYKQDLEFLDKGGHLSIGLGKKRQAAYDARDRAMLNELISKYSKQTANKAKSGTSPAKGKTAAKVALRALAGVGIVAGAGIVALKHSTRARMLYGLGEQYVNYLFRKR